MDNPQTDSCPVWADRLLRQIHDLEVKLGNLRDPQDAWGGGDLAELQQRAFRASDENDAELAQAEATVESLFGRVASGLASEGFDAAAIAGMINARVGRGGRLPYCDAREVLEVIDRTFSR